MLFLLEQPAANLVPHFCFFSRGAKPLLVRSAFDTKSGKLGEIAPGTLVFVLETRETADGSRRMRFAFAAPTGGMSEGGWVTIVGGMVEGGGVMQLAQKAASQAWLDASMHNSCLSGLSDGMADGAGVTQICITK